MLFDSISLNSSLLRIKKFYSKTQEYYSLQQAIIAIYFLKDYAFSQQH